MLLERREQPSTRYSGSTSSLAYPSTKESRCNLPRSPANQAIFPLYTYPVCYLTSPPTFSIIEVSFSFPTSELPSCHLSLTILPIHKSMDQALPLPRIHPSLFHSDFPLLIITPQPHTYILPPPSIPHVFYRPGHPHVLLARAFLLRALRRCRGRILSGYQRG